MILICLWLNFLLCAGFLPCTKQRNKTIKQTNMTRFPRCFMCMEFLCVYSTTNHMATCPELITRINETTARLWFQRFWMFTPIWKDFQVDKHRYTKYSSPIRSMEFLSPTFFWNCLSWWFLFLFRLGSHGKHHHQDLPFGHIFVLVHFFLWKVTNPSEQWKTTLLYTVYRG